eukprot:3704503-Prymnesium_polylepis.1
MVNGQCARSSPVHSEVAYKVVENATTAPQLASDELTELAVGDLDVCLTFVEDHLLLSSGEPGRRFEQARCWPRTFGFTWRLDHGAARQPPPHMYRGHL